MYFLVIELFDNQDRHEFDDQMALEVHSMKEHLFALLGKIQVSLLTPGFFYTHIEFSTW